MEQLKVVYRSTEELLEYDNNPRNNEDAVKGR